MSSTTKHNNIRHTRGSERRGSIEMEVAHRRKMIVLEAVNIRTGYTVRELVSPRVLPGDPGMMGSFLTELAHKVGAIDTYEDGSVHVFTEDVQWQVLRGEEQRPEGFENWRRPGSVRPVGSNLSDEAKADLEYWREELESLGNINTVDETRRGYWSDGWDGFPADDPRTYRHFEFRPAEVWLTLPID